jgi:5'(3')-deoxyribonucleotidase
MTLPILVDCDGVLADFEQAVLDIAEREYDITLRKDELTNWDHVCTLHPGLRSEVGKAISRGMCRNLLPCDGAGQFLPELERTYGEDKVLVLTRPWTTAPGVVCKSWLAQRAAWLEDFGVPESRLIQTGTPKWRIPGFLIDDAPHNLGQRGPGGDFCLARPWNRAYAGVRGTYADCLAYLKTVAL